MAEPVSSRTNDDPPDAGTDTLNQPPEEPANYPRRWESDVVLSDGATVYVRPIRPEDAERVVTFHSRQSPESIYYRFFSPRPRLSDRDVAHFTRVDYQDRLAFVALLGPDLIGVARYDALPPDEAGSVRAEVAFFIDDRHHGRGLATLLLEYLAVAASEAGIDGFVATVLPENRAMINVFRRAGFGVATSFEDGVVEVTLSTRATEAGLVSIEQRDGRAQAASVARLLNPATVAVIGAGRRPTSLGHQVLRQLVDGDFNGSVYPVNPHATHIQGIRAYPELAAIPDEIDLAVLAVPPSQLPEVLASCAAKGVEGLVVLTDMGQDGSQTATELVHMARRHGMRLIGPASIGIINHAADVRLRASFAPLVPPPGRVALSTQSGSMGNAIVAFVAESGLGLSSFVNLGHKGDVSGNDLLQYWDGDAATAVIALYLESFGNPRRFFSIARQLGRRKPVVVMRTAGLGPLDTGPEPGSWPDSGTFSALLGQAGVIETDSLVDLVGVARLLACQPLPRGPRVCVVANNAGSAALAEHTLRQVGLEPRSLVVNDEVTALAEAVAHAAFHPRPDPPSDAVLLVFSPTLAQPGAAVAAAVDAIVAQRRSAWDPPADPTPVDSSPVVPPRPVLTCYLGSSAAGVASAEGHLPRYRFPEDAARVLALSHRHAVWQAQDPGKAMQFPDMDLARVRDLVADALAGTGDAPAGIAGMGRLLGFEAAIALLGAIGLAPVAQRLVSDVDQALRAAASVGYPVALKALRRARLARSTATGVALGLSDPVELTAAYLAMAAGMGGVTARSWGPVVVQAMAEPGVDAQLLGHQDDRLGALVAVGRGGGQGDDRHQLAVAPVPLRSADPARLIAGSSLGPLLARLADPAHPAAHRIEQPAGADQGSAPMSSASASSAPASSVAALAAVAARISFLLEQVPEVVSVRLDPVLVSAQGVAITDVSVTVAPHHPSPLPPVRRLA
ncbi:MAG: GNAT family N-acetyltransferase [Acidimicrobiales bacterium]